MAEPDIFGRTPAAWEEIDPDREIADLLKSADSGNEEAREQIDDLERAEGEITVSRVALQEWIKV
jgi:hypothetical protein